jgi:hypothetical protein
MRDEAWGMGFYIISNAIYIWVNLIIRNLIPHPSSPFPNRVKFL